MNRSVEYVLEKGGYLHGGKRINQKIEQHNVECMFSKTGYHHVTIALARDGTITHLSSPCMGDEVRVTTYARLGGDCCVTHVAALLEDIYTNSNSAEAPTTIDKFLTQVGKVEKISLEQPFSDVFTREVHKQMSRPVRSVLDKVVAYERFGVDAGPVKQVPLRTRTQHVLEEKMRRVCLVDVGVSVRRLKEQPEVGVFDHTWTVRMGGREVAQRPVGKRGWVWNEPEMLVVAAQAYPYNIVKMLRTNDRRPVQTCLVCGPFGGEAKAHIRRKAHKIAHSRLMLKALLKFPGPLPQPQPQTKNTTREE